MSREILFRGKKWNADLERLNFVYGYLIDYDGIIDNLGNTHLVHQDTVGQYTGLKDKNGIKIFEGDILEDNYTDDDYNVVESNIAVVWDDITACWSVDNSFFQDGSSKTNLVEYIGIENLLIVGNIHDK